MVPENHPETQDARSDDLCSFGRCRVVYDVISLVGDKWSVLVVNSLGDGSRRFSDIKRTVDGISQKMLTVTLRALERDGFITRTVHPTVPPRVDYELTPLGRDLLAPVTELGRWALANHQRIKAARNAYDAREQG